MNIEAIENLKWYENTHGDIWIPPDSRDFVDHPPDGFDYLHIQLIGQVSHTVYCKNDRIAYGTSSYPNDLVLAMMRPSIVERFCQVVRYGRFAPIIKEHWRAVLLAANTCERCTNELAWRYGLAWGYRKGSEKWLECNTRCGRCDNEQHPETSA